jgi:hypothetical protein
MLPYLVMIFLLCLCAGVGTILVGLQPREENYVQTTRKRVVRLTALYGVAAILFLLVLLAFKTS